jgi:hypothetical protein
MTDEEKIAAETGISVDKVKRVLDVWNKKSKAERDAIMQGINEMVTMPRDEFRQAAEAEGIKEEAITAIENVRLWETPPKGTA